MVLCCTVDQFEQLPHQTNLKHCSEHANPNHCICPSVTCLYDNALGCSSVHCSSSSRLPCFEPCSSNSLCAYCMFTFSNCNPRFHAKASAHVWHPMALCQCHSGSRVFEGGPKLYILGPQRFACCVFCLAHSLVHR